MLGYICFSGRPWIPLHMSLKLFPLIGSCRRQTQTKGGCFEPSTTVHRQSWLLSLLSNTIPEIWIFLRCPVTILPSHHEPHPVLKRHGTCCCVSYSAGPAKHTSHPKRRAKDLPLFTIDIKGKEKPTTSRLWVMKVGEFYKCVMRTDRSLAGLENTGSMGYGHPM